FYYPDINVNDINDWYGKILAGLNKETYYFCISECTKNDFLKYRHDQLDEAKMLVTYPAVSQQYIPLYDFQRLETILNKHNVKYNKGDIYIYSLCSIEPRKNLIFTINCFIKFIKKHHTENLYFYIGGGQWNNFIETFNNELCDLKNYRDKIIWLGYIDDEDMNILYSNSLFFTYISQYEGFGMPPLEAMRAGTPVITSNNSSLPEVVGGAAITITYNDEEACIKSFEDLYFNETLRKEYIEKGLERAKLFSWDKTVKLMTDTIMETIDN
ncbi:MAG: glycosyltransferase family 4 protein, partial [Bacteroidales bacterium]|nr:glycosyltransferase family 4 protein [Bacteroidales bacterium]